METLKCKYFLNNIINEDFIYIILTQNTEKNWLNLKQEPIFLDHTYKIKSPSLKGYKYLVIVGYSDKEDIKPTYIMSGYQKGNFKAIKILLVILNYYYVDFMP